MSFRLLKCLAKAVARHGVKFLCNLVPGGEVLYDIAADAYGDYYRDQEEDSFRDEVQALAQASADQVRQEVLAAVHTEAAHLPAEVQQKLTTYLTQVPAMIRRSLRRPSDPTGTTVPASLSLKQPEDLLPFLPPRPPRFQPGDRPLPGVDWVLEEPLGVGGFGEVWKARHAHLRSKDPVALKFCLDGAAVAALRNEAGVLDRVMQHGKHPGIVRLLNTYLSADPPCLEYEYVEGGDLTGLIQELSAQGRLTPTTATRLFLHLAEIVAAAHRGDIVHDDLKLANVLVRREADGKIALRVTDFGIGGVASVSAVRESRQPTHSRQTLMTQAVRGAYTPLYAAPEQMARKRDELPDLRDDVHALGVIWYQLLTGDLGLLSMPTDWREEVQGRGLDEEMIRLLASCIASKAAKRPASAVVLVEGLRALLSPPPPPEKKERIPGQIITNSLAMKFAWCPPGSFLMGSPKEEEGREGYEGADETQHKVTLTKGFYLGVFPITRGQFARFVKDSSYRTEAERDGGAWFWTGTKLEKDPSKNWRTPGFDQTDEHPVVCVSWNDAGPLCEWLMQQDREGRRYRLPTEAEWEYACRAGTTAPFSFGATISTDQANYDGNYTYGKGKKGVYRQQTTPLGSFPANAWGLFDMHGNVLEWCQDWYGPYPKEHIKDPHCPDKGEYRVLRGGSWSYVPRYCRSASRFWLAPANRYYYVGCRVCLCLD